MNAIESGGLGKRYHRLGSAGLHASDPRRPRRRRWSARTGVPLKSTLPPGRRLQPPTAGQIAVLAAWPPRIPGAVDRSFVAQDAPL